MPLICDYYHVVATGAYSFRVIGILDASQIHNVVCCYISPPLSGCPKGEGTIGTVTGADDDDDPVCKPRSCLGAPWNGSPANGGIEGSCCDFTFFEEVAFAECIAGEQYYPCESGLECVQQTMAGDIDFGTCQPPQEPTTGDPQSCDDLNDLIYGPTCPGADMCDDLLEVAVCTSAQFCGCMGAPDFCSDEATICPECPAGDLCEPDGSCCLFGASPSTTGGGGTTGVGTTTTFTTGG